MNELILMTLFSESGEAVVGDLGETNLLRHIVDWLGPVSPPAPHGIGDDCAVIQSLSDLPQVLTTDSLIFGTHFDDTVSAFDAGQKLLKRNISDIAAMGGEPLLCVVALALHSSVKTAWLRDFYHGLRTLAKHYGIHISGGDISALSQPNFVANLTLLGQAARPVTRQGAHTGDRICTTGTLGGSRIKKHYAFTPRLSEGQWLARQPQVVAMMDITDGLAKDLPMLLPQGCCALLDPAAIPISDAARNLSRTSQRTPLHHALCDGEDYELLFAVAKGADLSAFKQHWQQNFALEISCIGTFAADSPTSYSSKLINMNTGQPLDYGPGFEHFFS